MGESCELCDFGFLGELDDLDIMSDLVELDYFGNMGE